MQKTVLGIETTCDETAAAIVSGDGDGRRSHPRQRGAEPDRGARGLWRRRAGDRRPRPCRGLDRLIARALDRAGIGFRDLDGIAVAAGPGLIGGVLVGLVTAKALALVSRKPLLAVNHLEAMR